VAAIERLIREGQTTITLTSVAGFANAAAGVLIGVDTNSTFGPVSMAGGTNSTESANSTTGTKFTDSAISTASDISTADTLCTANYNATAGAMFSTDAKSTVGGKSATSAESTADVSRSTNSTASAIFKAGAKSTPNSSATAKSTSVEVTASERPLVKACASGNYDEAKALIDAGAEVSGELLFHVVHSKCDPETEFKLMDLLILSGADVNHKRNDETPLEAIFSPNFKTIELLLQKGAAIYNSRGRVHLVLAATECL
jgi:hypothetical protein